MSSTNYYNTLIEVAEDSSATTGEPPPVTGDKTVGTLMYEMLHEHPYEFTSDDVVFSAFAAKKDLPEESLAEERERFFSKGQACLRASPLAKRYGWGIHSDEAGKVALYGVDSKEYRGLMADGSVAKKKAMRAKRAR